MSDNKANSSTQLGVKMVLQNETLKQHLRILQQDEACIRSTPFQSSRYREQAGGFLKDRLDM